jgi:fructosamine-3-kinase
MTPDLEAVIEDVTGSRVEGLTPLSGGCVGEVLLVRLADGGRLVAKLGPGLEPEAFMLRWLAARTRLPVPEVLHGEDDLLLMEFIDGADPFDARAQEHAAELLAALHGAQWHSFGFERDTVIGGLTQPNPPTERWTDFFRDHRLLYMARQALDAGRLPAALMRRAERLAARLGEFVAEPERPGLIHGDCWGGNILTRRGRVAAFIDPALYFADPEIELAFGTLFGTLGEPFFRRYHEIRPLRPGFFETRRDLYNLYPLLVHVRLFGGSYVAQAEAVLQRFG